jgi:hypothetical protein
MQLTPARVSSLLAGASALLAALAPAIANLDVTSTAGLFGGAVIIAGVVSQFLKGQRAHEARVAVLPKPQPLAVVSGSGTGVAMTGWTTTGATTDPIDSGDDGDDQLPAELETHPADEVNLPHGTVQP